MLSEYAKKKIGAANSIHMKRLWQDPEYRKNMCAKLKGRKSSYGMIGKKHSIESKIKLSIAHKGKTTWMKGRKLPEEVKKKISQSLKGYVKTQDHRRNLSESRKGIEFSECHRKRISEAHKQRGTIPPSRIGLVPWNYKGATKLQDQIRKNRKYIQWRSNIFIRDDFICKHCRIRGRKLNVDHIKTFANILKNNSINNLADALACEELWDLNNGRTLCENCHKQRMQWDAESKNNKEVEILSELL